MRSIVLRGLLGVIGLVVVWLFVGRQLSTLLDRLVTVRELTLPVSPLSCRFGTILIGDLLLSLSATPDERPIEVDCDASNRVVVSVDGRALELGTRMNSPTGSDFAPDQGDQVTLTVDRSILSWPTPLDLNFMTGQSPSWKRNVYYRLRWTKVSGASFTALWRFEQYFYDTWTSGMMTRAGSTGLMQAEIASSSR